MINPKAAVGNGSRLSCHNMPKTLSKQVFYMLSLESHNHADSYLAPIVEDMAEIGIQVWQGVLPENDIPALQQKLHGRLVLMGGMGAAIDRADAAPGAGCRRAAGGGRRCRERRRTGPPGRSAGKGTAEKGAGAVPGGAGAGSDAAGDPVRRADPGYE